MKLRKSFAIILMGMLAVSTMGGCSNSGSGSSSSDSSSSGGSSSSSNSNDGQLKIGLTMAVRDQFLTQIEDGVTNAIEDGVQFQVFDAENDTQKQISHIQTWRTQGYDAAIVNIVNPDDASMLVEEAGDMNLVFINRVPADAGLIPGQTVFVGSDEYHAGQIQAEYAIDRFTQEGKTEVSYALVMGQLGHVAQIERSRSVNETLENCDTIQFNKVFEDTGEWDRIKAMEKVQQFLGTGTHVDVIFANNDEMALGAVEALKAVGMTDVPVVGIDASLNGRIAVESGELAATVFQNAVGQAEGSYEAAIALAKGEPVPNLEADGVSVIVPFEFVDINNVENYK